MDFSTLRVRTKWSCPSRTPLCAPSSDILCISPFTEKFRDMLLHRPYLSSQFFFLRNLPLNPELFPDLSYAERCHHRSAESYCAFTLSFLFLRYLILCSVLTTVARPDPARSPPGPHVPKVFGPMITSLVFPPATPTQSITLPKSSSTFRPRCAPAWVQCISSRWFILPLLRLDPSGIHPEL